MSAPDSEADQTYPLQVGENSTGAENSAVTVGAPIRFAGRHDLLMALLTGAVYLAFLQIVARIPGGQMSEILATTMLSLLFTLLFTVYMARGLRSAGSLAAAGIVSCLLVLPSIVIPLMVHLHPEWPFWRGFAPRFVAYRKALHFVAGEDSLIMVTAAVSVGVLISRAVKEFKMLMPIAVMLALVDLYVVFGGGLVTQAEHGNATAARLMTSLTVQLPTVHPAVGVAPMQLAVGFADFLFVGLFFACFVKFNAPSRATFVVLFCTLAAYMLIVVVRNIAMPALVPIAVVVIGMHLRRFQYKRDELFALLYAGLIVAAAGGAIYLRRK